MAASGLGLEKLLVGAGCAISLLCTNGLAKQVFSASRTSISGSEVFFSV